MTLAERIERVLHFAALSSEECPAELLDDVTDIKCRYSEIKLTKDFEDAARLAKVEWLAEVINDHSNTIHDYYRN